MRFSKEKRQEIIREFAIRHNGHFNPRLFVDEVRSTGESHPAHRWFQWDSDKAAYEHWLWQAREFSSGLKITFSIEDIGGGPLSIRTFDVPLMVSPLHQRKDGGGYIVADPDNPGEHLDELCRQAANDLGRWLRRYAGTLQSVGGSPRLLEKQLKILEAATAMDEAAA